MYRATLFVIFSMVLLLGIGPSGNSQQQEGIQRVSIDSNGIEGNNLSFAPSISADGRFVAFDSRASNLVIGDGNNIQDVFVHDRQTGQTSRVSVNSNGEEGGNFGNVGSLYPSISADGRFIAFYSEVANLVDNDSNNLVDVFVHDRQTGQTSRVSVNSNGEEGNGNFGNVGSLYPSISADGRFIAFYSEVANLVDNDRNNWVDVFVHDRQTGQTSRISVNSNGEEGNGSSTYPSISADGRFVAFDSRASNLVNGDGNNSPDVFVHDRQTGQTSRVSIASNEEEGNNGGVFRTSISADGRFVAFASAATNFVSGGDRNNTPDVFVHDRQTGQTSRVSVNSNGEEGNGNIGELGSVFPSISADGRFVAFQSTASNLVDNDRNNGSDIFVHDRLTGQTSRVSIKSSGAEGNGGSGQPSISADGHFVAFASDSSNLIDGDNNGRSDIFVVPNPFQTPMPPNNNQSGEIAAPTGPSTSQYSASQARPKPCTDSDGGKFPNIFGVTKVRQLGGLSPLTLPFTDQCCGKSYLKEFSCDGDRLGHQWYRCNCRGGKCLKGPIQPRSDRQVPRECER